MISFSFSKLPACADDFTDSPIELITKPELFRMNHINVKFKKHRRHYQEKEKRTFSGRSSRTQSGSENIKTTEKNFFLLSKMENTWVGQK